MNIRQGFVVCLALCCVLFNASVYAQSTGPYITLALDNDEIYIGDAVVLEVESTGLLDPINLAPLESVVTVVRETIGTRIAVIKGKVVEIKIRRIVLIPNKPGNIVIGPLFAGEVASNSVFIRVLNETRPEWQPRVEDMQIQTTVAPVSPYVNQQALLTIDLHHRYPISNEQITLPDLDGFSKRVLIENRRTFSDEEKEWYRTRWQYLIFPSHSGANTIGAINWSGTAAKSRIERADFKRSHQPLTVNVKPAERDNTNDEQWWLPARSLALTEQWSSPVTELRAGDELLRIITVQASGLLAGQIPTPDVPESRALQQTLIDTSRSEETNGDTINATASFTYRVKAQSPIPVFMDTVRMVWWNTIQQQAAEVIIPARRINVGLPDRADVLKKLALQDTGTTRVRHWLQSAGGLQALVYFVAALATLVLTAIALPSLITRIKSKNKKRLLLQKIRSLAKNNDAPALYRLLHERSSREILSGADRQLFQDLQDRLYSTRAPQAQLPALSELITSIDHRRLPVKAGFRQPRYSTLARL